MLANYVYKIIPNKGQSTRMGKWIDMLRSTYNWCLADRIADYETHFMEGAYCDLKTRSERTPVSCCVSKYGATGDPWVESKPKLRNAGDIQITALPNLKKARPWYRDIDSTVLQQNVKRLDTAYKNFFEGKGFPKFKNRSNFTSFTFAAGVKLLGNKLYLPKIGWMRLHLSRPIPEGFIIKAATVRKRQDGWYVSLRIEDKTVPTLISKPLEEVKKILGCDLGLTKLVHLSDNAQIDNLRFGVNKKAKRTLSIRQRRVSRKQSRKRGSNRKKKAAIRVGRFHKKIADKRQAYQWKVANLIVGRSVDAIAVEDLNVAGMMKRCRAQRTNGAGRFLSNGQSRKKALNRAISDASWSELILKIEYLAAKRGKVVIKVDPNHSSQECRKCGHKDKSNREKERFICVSCGHQEHADIGAAKTVRDRAYKLIKVPADCGKLEGDIDGLFLIGNTSKRPKKIKETSPRSMSRSFANAQDGEPGNRNIEKSRKDIPDIGEVGDAGIHFQHLSLPCFSLELGL